MNVKSMNVLCTVIFLRLITVCNYHNGFILGVLNIFFRMVEDHDDHGNRKIFTNNTITCNVSALVESRLVLLIIVR